MDISTMWYRSIPDLKERQEKVLDTIIRYPGVSSTDISRIAKMNPSNVRSRITELLHQGKIEIIGTKKDKITHRMVRQYSAVITEESP